MTTRTTRTLMLALLVTGFSVAATAETDPHWDKGACQACHADRAPVAGNIALRETDAEALCASCHDRGATPCRHLSGVPVDAHVIGEQFRASLDDGRLVCSTCHDITYQCDHPSKPYSFMNPGFLRARTSPDTADHCFACHDKSGYEKLNPHVGSVNDPPGPICSLCHTSVPGASAGGKVVMEFNMQHDLNDMCRGCHVVAPHPRSLASPKTDGSWDHLVVPSAEVLENMRKAGAETGVVLPLSPVDGTVFCATCHNPHDSEAGAGHGPTEPGRKNRLRVNEICQACHDK